MKLVTIKTFNFPHEATIAIHLLEEEGIQSYVMDELSIQINPLYSNALGGAKLQVWEPDTQRALQILAEHNLATQSDLTQQHIEFTEPDSTEEDNEPKKPSWLTYKNIGLFFLAVAVALGIAAVMLAPGDEEKLIANDWCLNYVLLNTKQINPLTQGQSVYENTFCEERITFSPNGIIHFPGLNTKASYGYWKLDEKKLSITLDDKQLSYINGSYSIKIRSNQLTLISDKNSISASKIPDGY